MEDVTRRLIRPSVTEKGIVKAWEETVELPTYEIGEEEKNPVFLEKRVYQGSSGSVYPYPVVESVSDEKRPKPYRAFFIENEYLKIMILPELGGRVQMAYDKVRQRHFVYYNQVVKPALVGLTGPWISGGIEFNWPQHHRPSTFLPTEAVIETCDDGSATVWCNEVERMFRTKGMQGFTLRPGKAYLEISVKIYNRTPFPQTFLWWANPAVVVNDGYHSVFPPDVHAVFDHGRRDVSTFPIAMGVYYKQDYSAGVDISRYRNVPVPTSYMAVSSKYDFVGGYEADAHAGLLHVADHHISPGKKQWTWGNGDFGRAWDRNLTDEDGPYIELMTGVHTDNQPDFSWLQPYEEKSWKQYFMPYAEVGYVKNATKDIITGLDREGGNATVKVYATSEMHGLTVRLKSASGEIFFDKKMSVSPLKPFAGTVAVAADVPDYELVLEVLDDGGKTLVSYNPEKPEKNDIPEPAKAAKPPGEISSTEQLFLTGQHLEQYRHATFDPTDYYGEALRREPGDIRCNNAMGLLLLRRGRFAEAESYFRRAVETQTERNPNPYDGEPYYNLGWSLNMQGKTDEAYDAFYKAVWNAAWQDAGYLNLARIDTLRGNLDDALEKVEKSLVRNWHNHQSRQLKASLLRKSGRREAALGLVDESLAIDPFNMGVRFEKYLLTGDKKELRALNELFAGATGAYIEYALDFVHAGLYEEADELLHQAPDNPVVWYTLGYAASLSGDGEKAADYYRKGFERSPDRVFPNRIEEVNILRDALKANPEEWKAAYFLGNFFYAARQYDIAVDYWELSARINDTFPTVLRNLSLAYYNKLGRKEMALQLLEKAFGLDTSDARVLMELDQLRKKLNVSPRERLENLEKYRETAEKRDDLVIELIALYNLAGEYEKAAALSASRRFHPWEGGEGKITKQYVTSRVEMAKQALVEKRYARALELLNETDSYPHNLGEGKLPDAGENDIEYYKGLAYRGLGDEANARKWFEKATKGVAEPQQAFFYYDTQPDGIYFQGLAWRALGDESRAGECFRKLVDHGHAHIGDECRIDYFAVSLPELSIWEDDLTLRNRIHCHYVMALGYLGLGEEGRAREEFRKVLALDKNHQANFFSQAL